MTRKYFVLLSLLLLSMAGPLSLKWSEAATLSPARNFKNRDRVKAEALPPIPEALADEAAVLVAWKSRYRMGLYNKGQLVKSYVIGLGQAPLGHKERQGDNRTPEGEYRIIQKTTGPFRGRNGRYLGKAWMRLNYPNEQDAESGFARGLISEAEKEAIIAANRDGREPPKSTRLGGGIGIHGWWGRWPG
ncbi:MAG TPA: L,D-transpeptidase, partial [Desulfurivibrionaceae bacterium]|nr:L,D-transpeptidase [Desulfurivibrionaceae bacterium]